MYVYIYKSLYKVTLVCLHLLEVDGVMAKSLAFTTWTSKWFMAFSGLKNKLYTGY